MLSIVIPTTLKTEEYLDFCIKSINDNTTIKYEIIVEPNGKGTSYPQGQWAAANRAIKDAQYEWIYLLNDDMALPKGWDKDLIFPSECFSPQTNWLSEPVSGLNYATLDAGTTLETFNKEMVDDFMMNNTDTIVENGFHFPIIFKKSLWERVGGFDERFDPYGSNGDSDFEYKVVCAGVQPKFYHGTFAYHFGSKSESFSADKQIYWQKNWDYFKEKWGFTREETPDIQRADLHIPADKFKEIR